MEDCLTVTYDQSDTDKPTLTVSRNGMVLNQLNGNVAFGIYFLLTDMSILKNNETINTVLFQLKCIKEHLKFISQTVDKSVDFDVKTLDGCISQLEDMLIQDKNIFGGIK